MIKIAALLTALAIALCNGFHIQSKILKGTLSNPKDYPFFVYITTPLNTCSATLLSERWVLTAGHCVRNNVTLEVNLGIDEKGEFHEKILVEPSNQHLYPGYIYATPSNQDIALIELPRKIESSPIVRPIQLPTECGEDLEGVDVIALGNGIASMRYLRGDTLLRQMHQTTMSFQDCENVMYRLRRRKQFTVICTSVNEGRSLFAGDSGGPLLRGSNGSLIGVASFAEGIGGRYPAIVNGFTRIHLFYEWLSEVTGLDLPKCPQ